MKNKIKVAADKANKIRIGEVIYKDNEYPIYLAKSNMTRDIQAYKDGKDNYIQVNIDWIKTLGYTRIGEIWHEISLLCYNLINEYEIDKFICERIGFESFMRYADDLFARDLYKIKYSSREIKLKYRSYYDYRILAMAKVDKTIDDSYQISFFNSEYNSLEKIQKAWDEKL